MHLISDEPDDDEALDAAVLETVRSQAQRRGIDLGNAIDELYGDLKRSARAALRASSFGQTLSTTGVVHEAYLRMAQQRKNDWSARHEVFAVAAIMMRRIVCDQARLRLAQKRGGDVVTIRLEDAEGLGMENDPLQWLALDAAIERLTELEPRAARAIECRYFGGMSLDETAQVLAVSLPTVKRDLRLAQAWLKRELQSGPGQA